MQRIRIGFMSSNAPNFTPHDVAAACRDFGFQTFEPRIDWGHRHAIEPDAPPGRVEEARSILEDHGVEVPCVATGIQIAVPAGAKRRDAVDACVRAAELCRRIGAAYVRIFGGGEKHLDEETRVGLAVETLGEAAQSLEGSDVTLLLETHDFFGPGRLVGRVLDAVDHPGAGALWDSMHPYLAGEDLGESVRHLRPERIKHTHTRDLYVTAKDGGGYDWAYCDDYGEGNFPLADVQRLLEGLEFTGAVSLERIFDPKDTGHDARAFLKAHGKGMRAVHQTRADMR